MDRQSRYQATSIMIDSAFVAYLLTLERIRRLPPTDRRIAIFAELRAYSMRRALARLSLLGPANDNGRMRYPYPDGGCFHRTQAPCDICRGRVR